MSVWNKVITWMPLAVTVTVAAGVADAGADGLSEAARLAAHAQAVEDRCQYHESAEWMGKAIGLLKHYRSADPAEYRTAGSMLAQFEIHVHDVKQRPAEFDRQQRTVEQLLAVARTESADQVLRQVQAPPCEARFARLEAQVAQRQAEARNLIRQGEEATRRYDKKAALLAFQSAAAADAEAPGLAEGWRVAHTLRGSHKALKVFAAILATGALAGGGYYAYDKYLKKPAAQSKPR